MELERNGGFIIGYIIHISPKTNNILVIFGTRVLFISVTQLCLAIIEFLVIHDL